MSSRRSVGSDVSDSENMTARFEENSVTSLDTVDHEQQQEVDRLEAFKV